MSQPSKVAILRARGFDLAEAIPGQSRWRIRCSQCEACSINGIPCHERGCPNIPHEDEEED